MDCKCGKEILFRDDGRCIRVGCPSCDKSIKQYKGTPGFIKKTTIEKSEELDIK